MWPLRKIHHRLSHTFTNLCQLASSQQALLSDQNNVLGNEAGSEVGSNDELLLECQIWRLSEFTETPEEQAEEMSMLAAASYPRLRPTALDRLVFSHTSTIIHECHLASHKLYLWTLFSIRIMGQFCLLPFSASHCFTHYLFLHNYPDTGSMPCRK